MTSTIQREQHQLASDELKLPTPRQLRDTLPLSTQLSSQIQQQRKQIVRLLNGHDNRFMVIVGPCSIDDEAAALDYGKRLATLARHVDDKLLIVMRAYVEKPRTTHGWKGLAYDSLRDGRGNMALGLHHSRQILLQLSALGLPLASEALHPLVMSYLNDLISWAAIGARTSESQPHREMVSNLLCPVGIKNSTDGRISSAINAMHASSRGHHTLGIDEDGQISIINTRGNPDTHLILRGGQGLTNYDSDSIHHALSQLSANDCHEKVLIDCSHDNSLKQYERQMEIAHHVVDQHLAGNNGILGLMLESYIEAGKQNDSDKTIYGQSITDACLGWNDTEALLTALYQKLRKHDA
jgi:3-deoxy-7-phosphoheptulonate synthase